MSPLRTSSSAFLDDIMGDSRRTRRGPQRGDGQAGIPRHHLDSGGGSAMVRRGQDPDPQRPQENETGMSALERRRQILRERGELTIDTSEMEGPEFDRSQARLNKIITGTGAAVSLIGALGGSEIAARAGEGLAKGGAGNLRRQRKAFRRRRQSFQEKLQAAQEYNREVQLSVSEGRESLAATEAEREFQRQMSEDEREAQKALVRLRNRLETQLSPAERRKVEKEIDLIEARIGSQEALATERRAQAAAALRPDSDGGSGGGGGTGLQAEARKEFGNLSDEELKNLLTRGSQLIETGKPPAADFDDSGRVTQSEMQQYLGTGNSPPSQSDMSRVSERVNLLRAEARRRGLLGDGSDGEGRGGGTASDSTETTVPGRDSTGAGRRGAGTGEGRGGERNLGAPTEAEIREARALVEEGLMTPREFAEAYPNADLNP